MLSPLAGEAVAQRSVVPASGVTLPGAVDWQAEYQGQHLCSPRAKPGALRLSALLARTYGRFTTYISRSCATPGISEHEEGRAIDWMVDSEIPSRRAKAWQFLNWLTAPGPGGEPAVMARRLGVMYLIYEDKMWRVYRPEDGWAEYSGCSAKQGEDYDTSCHRDHIHISLTWDGAYARTSFWTGRAETRGPCESARSSKPNGSPAHPVTLINGNTGIGVTGENCRLAADAYSDRTYRVKVPVPTTASGAAPIQRVLLQTSTINAPVGLTMRSASRIRIPPGTRAGSIISVPLNDKGVITVTLGAGYGDVVLRGVGTGAGSVKPTAVSLRRLADRARVNTPMTVTGRVKRAPAAASLSVQRRVAGGAWTQVAGSVAVDGRYSLPVPAVPAPGAFEYRAVVAQGGAVLDESRVRRQTVLPAEITLAEPRPVKAGRTIRLRGAVVGVPAGGQVRLLMRGPGLRGSEWRTVKQRPQAGAGRYRFAKRIGKPGALAVRTELVSGARVLARSAKVRVSVGE